MPKRQYLPAITKNTTYRTKKLIGMWSHTHANEFCDFHNTAIYCILYISFFLSMMCIFLLFFYYFYKKYDVHVKHSKAKMEVYYLF